MTRNVLAARRTLLPAAALLSLLLAGACAPARPLLVGGEREEAERFFRARWSAAPFPVRAVFSGTATAGPGAWPLLLGVDAPSPERESAGLYSPFGHEVATVRNDGVRLAFEAGPLSGPLSALDRKSLPAEGFSLGRAFSGAPALEPRDGEYYRGEGGEWVHEGPGQTLRSDPGRRSLSAARYRLAGQDVDVAYPGWDGAGVPDVVTLSGGGVAVRVRRDAE